MKRKLFTLLMAATLATPTAIGVTLNSYGSGQVLLYPYYTVNKQQQTLISVSNTTSHGKALKVRFREGRNGRAVLYFNVFLSAHDTWTGALFSLSDAALPGAGGAILVVDTSCTAPNIATVSPKLPNGTSYQPFVNSEYIGALADSGPTDDARTREGYLEIIEIAELSGNTLAAITPVNGVPVNCSAVQIDPPAADLSPPGGGLVGTEAIVNVAQGTFFTANAYAIDGFSNRVQSFSSVDGPNLGDASVSANGLVSAYVPVNGRFIQLDYPPNQAIDAISALLMADHAYAAWDVSPSEGAQTDLVLTLPTKHFYVDPLTIGTIGTGPSIAPFPFAFGEEPGLSSTPLLCSLFDRSGALLQNTVFDPRPSCLGNVPYETQVLSFLATAIGPVLLPASPVFGSALAITVPILDTHVTVGTAIFDLSFDAGYRLRPSANGYTMNGLPLIGFEAVNYINANVTPGVLANYSGSYPLRASASCASTGSNTDAACAH
jgi:hypothetical protein